MKSGMAVLVLLVAVATSPTVALASSSTTVRALRADYWEDAGGRWLSVEGSTTQATVTGGSYTGPALAAAWRDADGAELGAGSLQAVVDTAITPAAYKHHLSRYRIGLPGDGGMPASVTVSAPSGESDTVAVTRWADGHGASHPVGFLEDFNTRYVDPQEAYRKLRDLAAEFPSIAQVYDLPNKTAGYQRRAQTVLGIAAPYTGATGNLATADQARAVVLTSLAWGHDGGNGITARLADPGAPSVPLRVDVAGAAITVRLETDAAGTIRSTAAQVADAINSDGAASALVTANPYRTSHGSGVVVPQSATSQLSDWLRAPSSYPRGPQTVGMLRIGSHRDGSKAGVFIYCQEGGREWTTPLVCLETAERLVRNYATDPETKALVDGLDIFIVPTVNPDGAAYSMYDASRQTRNTVNYFASDPAGNNDPLARDNRGVAVGRNFPRGSWFDGYIGGSGNCLSNLFSGPFELSEPEARNEQWVESTFANIKFALNVRASGGTLSWPPGAYKPDGATLPAPGYVAESYFGQTAAAIVNRVYQYRHTAILPEQTGPMTEVVGSSAGNSTDAAYYDHGIVAFDLAVGANRVLANGTSVATGFQPCFGSVGTGGGQGSCPATGTLVNEGHDQAMEFADGGYALLNTALEYANDTTAPTAEAVGGSAVSQVAQQVRFTTSEPAAVFYTTDGSTPTTTSSEWQQPDPLPLTIARSGTLRWIAVDFKGNRSAVRSRTFVIDSVPPTVSFMRPAGERAVFVTGQPAPLSYSCADEPGGSGVASCLGSTADGATLDTSTPGSFSYSVTARDAAGNESTATRSYTVEPDADEDLVGDTTQDRCPGQAGSAAGCPPPPAATASPTVVPPPSGPVMRRHASIVVPRKAKAASLVKGVRTTLSGLAPGSKVAVQLRARSKVLARVRGRADAAGTVTLKLKLSRREAQRLRHNERLTIRYAFTEDGGARLVVSRSLRVR